MAFQGAGPRTNAMHGRHHGPIGAMAPSCQRGADLRGDAPAATMRCRLHRFALTKAVPLAISRGTTSAVEHLLLEVEHDGLTG
ncbi:MAG: hypothetical protein ACKO0M_09745, partial [Cyanobium sp.]